MHQQPGPQGPTAPSASPTGPDDTVLGPVGATAVVGVLAPWLPAQRWYPVKGVATRVRLVRTVPLGPGVVSLLVAVERADDDGAPVPSAASPDAPLLHVPVVVEPAPPDGRTPPGSAVGSLVREGLRYLVHDGARHRAFWAAVLRGARWEDGAGWSPRPGPGGADGPDLTGARVVAGEQSNTSVVMPQVAGGAILKVLRTVAPGPNPDLDVPRALARAGWHGVPRPLAWWSVDAPASAAQAAELHLAILSELVPRADDGFELACAFAGRAESFAGHAAALGTLVAQLHAALRRAYGTGPAVDGAWLVDDLRARAVRAVGEAPTLARREAGIAVVHARAEAALAASGDRHALPRLQRIHGDLHLGQVLHGADGWRVLDFEGEPLRPVAERTRPDLALRDAAGMLRSFDYAAAVGRAHTSRWAAEARDAFWAAYRAGRGDDPASPPPGAGAQDDLLAALELDKALYEVVYEVRNRPDWVGIPLAGVDRILERAAG
ncbi:aminoglycoside phosphotransferase [Luteimicrobium sp. NPDC057192]|uniref:maltokinase N-terminal cap-like domain-containing protein n=1 Tax=Luteimicrobium sp. NPDC057192 TaxID=3346042 RepID=UPI0036287377